jgi:hypothetical protein
MGYTTHELKIPDDRSWIAIVEVTPDGESTIIGYVDLAEFQQLAITGGKLFYLWQNHMSG